MFDVIIVGTGSAGTFCALNLDPKLKVLIITKTDLAECNSYLAQGGITTILDNDDIQSFIEDSLIAGKYQNDINALTLLAQKSEQVLKKLLSLNVPFETKNGKLLYTKEGSHSKNRIIYIKDETGKFLMESLITELKKRTNITIWENSNVLDILEDKTQNKCVGFIIQKDNKINKIYSKFSVMATGGIGGIFKNSTNQKTLVGDCLAIAYKHNIDLKDIDYVQFHPTSLFSKSIHNKSFLISEAVRGEGGILLNHNKQRFVNELLPRDIVTTEILKNQTKDKQFVYLDISHKEKDFIINRFPNIYKKCLEEGINIAKDPIPVTPAQHYHMGGIKTNLQGMTSLPYLYAIGEVACTGVHGSNRLASNSLLEALVFANEASLSINNNFYTNAIDIDTNLTYYEQLFSQQYRINLLKNILHKGGKHKNGLFEFR